MVGKGISVIICTYNSEFRICDTLNHIKDQIVPNDIIWEVLIVDFNSNDKTVAICNQFKEQFPVPLSVINEELPGKSSAMVSGFKHAKGEIFCIVDDDNWVASNYIEVAYATMQSHKDVGMIGGFGKPFFQSPKPEWFDAFSGIFAVGHQFNKQGYLPSEKNWFWGAASVIRKSAWDAIRAKGFRFILNPSRDGLSMFKKGFAGGEDQELCFAVQLCGYKLWYEPNLEYTHFISSNRLTKNYIIKTVSGTSTAVPVLKMYQSFLIDDTFKGKVKMYSYTIVPFMFVHDIYVFMAGIKQALGSPYKGIFFKIAVERFKSSVYGLTLLNGKKKAVMDDIRKLKAS